MAFDPHLGHVPVLLHGDGANNGTVITESAAGRTMSRVGNVVTSTGTKKFGTASLYFDGTGDAITAADSAALEIGSKDFTIETWGFLTALPGVGVQFWICGKYNGGVTDTRSFLFYLNNDGGTYKLRMLLNSTGLSGGPVISTDVSFASAPAVFAMMHLAVTRESGTVRFFVNGTQLGADQTNNTVAFDGASLLMIGGTDTGANGWVGNFDDLRLTIGKARYTANFTPPTEALPDAGTVWLDNFNGTNGSATFNTAEQQLGGVMHPYVVGGNAQYSTAAGDFKFGTAALKLDGDGDYLTLPALAKFDFGTGDFTIEFHAKRKGNTALYGGGAFIIDGRTVSVTTNRPLLIVAGPEGSIAGGVDVPANTIYCYVPGATSPTLIATSEMVLNQIYHIVLQKKDDMAQLFIDGELVDEVADTNSWSINGGNLGAKYTGAEWFGFNGTFDALRITKGYARYS